MSLRNFAEPVTLVRSPTFTNSESLPMLSGSRPARRVLPASVGGLREGSAKVASRMRRMCSGVVPQQPPTRLRNPLAANSRRMLAVSAGVSSYSPNALGSPAFGYAHT